MSSFMTPSRCRRWKIQKYLTLDFIMRIFGRRLRSTKDNERMMILYCMLCEISKLISERKIDDVYESNMQKSIVIGGLLVHIWCGNHPYADGSITVFRTSGALKATRNLILDDRELYPDYPTLRVVRKVIKETSVLNNKGYLRFHEHFFNKRFEAIEDSNELKQALEEAFIMNELKDL